MYRTFVLPGAGLREGGRPRADKKGYRGKEKYEDSYDTQAQPVTIRQGLCKSGGHYHDLGFF